MHKNGNGNEKGKSYRDFIFVQVPRLHGNEPHFCAVFVQNENERTCFDGQKGKNCNGAGARGEKFGTSEEPERVVLHIEIANKINEGLGLALVGVLSVFFVALVA